MVHAVRRIDPDVTDIVRTAGLWPGEQSRRLLLGLVGEPGVGKSTVAAAIVAAIGTQAVQIPMDGYHLADRVLREHGTLSGKGSEPTFDGWGYRDFLRRAGAETAHSHYAPVFERELEQPIANAIEVRPDHRLLVSEGNYLLLGSDPWPDVARCFDRIWFLTMDPEVRRQRLIARHVEFGKSAAEARAWALGGDERNAEAIRATRHRADLVLEVTDLVQERETGAVRSR